MGAAEVFNWIGSEMNRADRYVDVPAEPEGDVVWTQRDMFSTRWQKWTRVRAFDGLPDGSRWSAGQPGFTHTWGSLHVYHRRVVVSDEMPAGGAA